MFKLTAVICFLSMGVDNLDLCMKAELPIIFQTHVECREKGTHIAEYMDKDLINRNVAITFACEESKYQNATLFRSSI
tara:strand:- start:491 stop:724 length:234 start_codon:yes stop_codon:yes gene_type:complete